MSLQLNSVETIIRDPEICRYTKEIHRLNDILRREFGERHGYQRFRWMLYSELHFVRKVDSEIIPVSSFTAMDGKPILYSVQPVFKVRSFAELHGIDGWVVAEFIRHPISYDAHLQIYGNEVAYNPYGKYESVGGTELDFTQSPNENVNQLVIKLLRLNVNLTEKDADELAEQEESRQKKQRDASFKTSLDIIENAMTAFGEDPGKKGSTSFRSKSDTAPLIQIARD